MNKFQFNRRTKKRPGWRRLSAGLRVVLYVKIGTYSSEGRRGWKCSITMLYMIGMTTNVNTIDTRTPLMRAMAMGGNRALPEYTSGVRPIIVVLVLSIMGRMRLFTASIQDC